VFSIPTALRRPLAVAGAAAVGLAATVALASPASAHHSVVVGEAVCDTATGEYDVTWTITVVAPPQADHYTFVEVAATKGVGGGAPQPATVPGVEVTPGNTFPHPSGSPLVSTYSVPGDTTSLSLSVRAKWSNGHKEKTASSDSIQLAGTCAPDAPRPDATANADCEYLVVTLSNKADATKDAVFVFSGSYEDEVTVAKGGEPVEVRIPRDKAGDVTVTERGTRDWRQHFAWKDPGNCGVPAGTYEVTCDDLTFYVENPADGREVTVTFTPSTGDAVTRTVKPGEEMEPVVFPASAGLTVRVSTEGEDDVVISYDDEKPEDCGAGGGGPELPRTGPSAGVIAGGAGALLAAGAGLFLFARRRRLRFTA